MPNQRSPARLNRKKRRSTGKKKEYPASQTAKHAHPPYSHPPDDDEPTQEQPKPDEPCLPQAPRYTLYVCLRYAECETDFAPAPFDECACSANGQKPGRICESYEVEITTEAPASLETIEKLKEQCAVGDCETLYCETLKACRDPRDLGCILLAVIYDYTPGKKITKGMINNWKYRLVLPSTTVLDQLIRCILDKLPTRKLTRIQQFNWDHEGEYSCHEFMHEFIGTEKEPRAFEIEFEQPLFRAGLNRRTFQAIVVRYPQAGGPGQMEVVPGRVSWSNENKRIFLAIDWRYAQTLHGVQFDLYIRLRCDFFLDLHGRAVDGELRARLDEDNYELAPYTGNNIPGGLFESWIRVR